MVKKVNIKSDTKIVVCLMDNSGSICSLKEADNILPILHGWIEGTLDLGIVLEQYILLPRLIIIALLIDISAKSLYNFLKATEESIRASFHWPVVHKIP